MSAELDLLINEAKELLKKEGLHSDDEQNMDASKEEEEREFEDEYISLYKRADSGLPDPENVEYKELVEELAEWRSKNRKKAELMEREMKSVRVYGLSVLDFVTNRDVSRFTMRAQSVVYMRGKGANANAGVLEAYFATLDDTMLSARKFRDWERNIPAFHGSKVQLTRRFSVKTFYGDYEQVITKQLNARREARAAAKTKQEEDKRAVVHDKELQELTENLKCHWLIVGNLPSSVTKEGIEEIFPSAVDITMPKQEEGEKSSSKGYAYILFTKKEMAEKSLARNDEVVNVNGLSIQLKIQRKTMASKTSEDGKSTPMKSDQMTPRHDTNLKGDNRRSASTSGSRYNGHSSSSQKSDRSYPYRRDSSGTPRSGQQRGSWRGGGRMQQGRYPGMSMNSMQARQNQRVGGAEFRGSQGSGILGMHPQVQPGLNNIQQQQLFNLQQQGLNNLQQPGLLNMQQPGLLNMQQPGLNNMQQSGLLNMQQAGLNNMQQPGLINMQQAGLNKMQQQGINSMQLQQQPALSMSQRGGIGSKMQVPLQQPQQSFSSRGVPEKQSSFEDRSQDPYRSFGSPPQTSSRPDDFTNLGQQQGQSPMSRPRRSGVQQDLQLGNLPSQTQAELDSLLSSQSPELLASMGLLHQAKPASLGAMAPSAMPLGHSGGSPRIQPLLSVPLPPKQVYRQQSNERYGKSDGNRRSYDRMHSDRRSDDHGSQHFRGSLMQAGLKR